MKKKFIFICEDCGKECSTSKNKKPNPDTGKMLCGPCSTKYTNARKEKREKNSRTIKNRYDNGELDYMRNIASNMLIGRNKSWLKELNTARSDADIIANKKRYTWFKRPEDERKEINFKRTVAFRKYNTARHNNKVEWFNSLSEKAKVEIKNHHLKYKLYDPEWEDVRKATLKKANYKCECCHTKTSLDVHHAIPFIHTLEHKYLYALCRKCHMKIERRFEREYAKTKNLFEVMNYSLELLNDKKL